MAELILNNINKWLLDSQEANNKSIQETACIKWNELNENSTIHIPPCICSVRSQECIDIECYYEVKKAYLIMQKEPVYKVAIQEYEIAKDSKEDLFNWFIKHNILFEVIKAFKNEINIYVGLNPYKINTIKINTSKVPHLMKLKSIIPQFYPEQ